MSRRFASVRLLSRFQGEIERLFREALELAGEPKTGGRWQPALDILETSTSILLYFEVPGLTAEDLAVEVEGSQVRVSGRKTPRSPAGEGARFLCAERERGTFERRVQLFWPVNSHRGRARLAGGLLTLEFPKIEDKRQAGRRLEIEVEPGEA
jgi:HSP20 family protein